MNALLLTPLDITTTPIDQKLVLDLTAIDSGMLPLVGGKGANLGVMTRAGLPVPPGFCVTTKAYRQVAARAFIDFDALACATPENAGELARQAREAMLAVPIPDKIAEAIASGYARFGEDKPVAVRSSATAEDLPTASFAGQQDTYLHIVGKDAVLDAVRRCWASLWTERAVVYRMTNGIDHGTVQLSVVVQRMVEAEVAGVLFTANPVTGRRRQAVIDASPGLGEAVVSGAVNPDHFVVETATGEILERRLGDKRFEVRPLPGGGTTHVEKERRSDLASVTDDQIRALAELGDRVEAHYKSPQDTEWAIDAAGRIWLTQARPITTLFPLPVQKAPGHRVYLSFSVAQGLYRPITPAGLSGFKLISAGAARLLGIRVDDPLEGAPVYTETGQRVYIDITNVLRSRFGRWALPQVLGVMEARSGEIVRELLKDERLSMTRRTPFQFISRVLPIALRYAVPVRIAQALMQPTVARTRAERVGEELMERLRPMESVSLRERLDLVERTLSREIGPMLPAVMPSAAAGFAMLGVAAKLLGEDARPGDLQTVLRGLPHNITTEMDLELWDLATAIRQDTNTASSFLESSPGELARLYRAGALPGTAQRGIAEFLNKYGHRAIAEIDLGMPRWSDDATHIIGVLTNYLRMDDSEMAPSTQFARGAAAAEDMIETLVERVKQRSPVRAGIVRFALNRARQLAGLRELPKFYAIQVLAAARRELGIIGGELAHLGRIEQKSDVFFLEFGEIRTAIDGRNQTNLVARRRMEYNAELRRKQVPRILLSDGTEPEATSTASSDENGLTGTAASSGVVTGIARVVLDPVAAHLEPGEILVAPSTDPGWTPLFLTAGGLVMEMGGANSHGAVVAREYGIPAVVGVRDATTRIRTGQRISVDGASGVIALL